MITDTLTIDTAGEITNTAGDFVIDAAGLTASDNFTLTNAAGDFSVTPAGFEVLHSTSGLDPTRAYVVSDGSSDLTALWVDNLGISYLDSLSGALRLRADDNIALDIGEGNSVDIREDGLPRFTLHADRRTLEWHVRRVNDYTPPPGEAAIYIKRDSDTQYHLVAAVTDAAGNTTQTAIAST